MPAKAAKFDAALETLFGDPSIGHGFLTLPTDELIQPSSSLSLSARVAELENSLMNYVMQCAAELEEFGESERVRLQSEARATLVALREVRRWLRPDFEV